jgi:hypothetical protein
MAKKSVVPNFDKHDPAVFDKKIEAVDCNDNESTKMTKSLLYLLQYPDSEPTPEVIAYRNKRRGLTAQRKRKKLNDSNK